MSKGQLSVQERDRLCDVADLDLEEARPGLERIARLAQCLAAVPMAYVAIPQGDRLWLAGSSRSALPTDLSRSTGFTELIPECGQGSSLWVEDASRDERFSANPFVAFPYNFRFFAGAPIRLFERRLCRASLCLRSRTRARLDPHAHRAPLDEFARLGRRRLRAPPRLEPGRRAGGRGWRGDRESAGDHRDRAGGVAATDRDLVVRRPAHGGEALRCPLDRRAI